MRYITFKTNKILTVSSIYRIVITYDPFRKYLQANFNLDLLSQQLQQPRIKADICKKIQTSKEKSKLKQKLFFINGYNKVFDSTSDFEDFFLSKVLKLK